MNPLFWKSKGVEKAAFPTVNAQVPGGLDSRTQPTVVLSSVGHLQALDQKDPPSPVHNVLVAAALRQLLIPSEPAHVSIGFGDLADQLDAVCFCGLHVGQVLGEAGLLLCDERVRGEAQSQKESAEAAATLTDDGQHARRLGGPGITLVLGLVVKHRLVDDEDVLAALGDDFIFLPFPDLTAVSEPADLWEKRRGERTSPNAWQPQGCSPSCPPWRPHIRTWRTPSL